MSDIEFNCSKCGKHLVVDSKGAGLKVDCPECSNPIQVPYESTKPVPSVDDHPIPEAQKPTGVDDVSPSAGPPVKNDEKEPSDSIPLSKETKITSGRKTLFALARILVLVASVIVIAGVVLAGVRLFTLSRKNLHYVSYKDIQRSLNLSRPKRGRHSEPIQQCFPGIDIPENVEKHFNDPGKRRRLFEWTKNLDEKKRKDFIYNLSKVLTEAEKGSNNVSQVNNEYARIKLSRLKLGLFETYMAEATKASLITFITFMAGLLLALFCLILVLAGMERNMATSQAATKTPRHKG